MDKNTKTRRKTAPKPQPRTQAARVPLTDDAYAAIEAAAFKNCRTVSQELTYRIEAGLRGPSTPAPYYPPSPPPPLGADAPTGPYMETTPQVTVTSGVPPEVIMWTQEQEAMIEAAAKTAGVGEGQLAALRLIHKTPEAVLAAVQAEAREPAGAPA